MGHAARPVWLSEEELAEIPVDYRRHWLAYRTRRVLALVLGFGWVPVCLALFALSRFWLHFPLLALTLMLLWLSAALAAIWWAGQFRCPRCRRRYGAASPRDRSTNWTRGLFDKICANCKLRKYESA